MFEGKLSYEDRLSAAQWHVAEADRRVGDQRALIDYLEAQGHHKLADQGRTILKTLDHSLRLASWGLAIIQTQTRSGAGEPNRVCLCTEPQRRTRRVPRFAAPLRDMPFQ